MMSEPHEWQDLIDRHLRGELNEAEQERLAELLDSDPALRHDFVQQAEWDTRMAEVLRESSASIDTDVLATLPSEVDAGLARTRAPSATVTRIVAAFVALSLLTFSIAFVLRPDAERDVATITGASGSLLWTMDGGRVLRDLHVGTRLPGGTVEGLAPDSWVQLEFADGSTFAIYGNSMLTFSNIDQKELYLKEGNVSCNVLPQPRDKPMLVHTRSAMLEVKGTQFEVETDVSATMLNVNRGQVRVKRLSDGNTMDVPARHRVVAAADREMALAPMPNSVDRWISQLELGPEGTMGKWFPRTDTADARLKAVPYITKQGTMIYAAAVAVSHGDRPPVILQPTSRLRVRGRLNTPHNMYCGVTVRHASGDFAGNFQIIRPAAEFTAAGDFQVVFDLDQFHLDPSLARMKDRLPTAPFRLVVESTWCHTLGNQAGLELFEVEMLPPIAP
jgi:ferric-dicitrate binding protein FerR (iron transport regulator)